MDWLKQYFTAIPVLTHRGLNLLKLTPQWHQLPKDLQLFVEVAVNSQSEGLTAEQFNRWVNQTKDTNSQIPSDIKGAMTTSTSKPLRPSQTITTHMNENTSASMGATAGATLVKPVEPPKVSPVVKTKDNPFRQEVDKLKEYFNCKITEVFQAISDASGTPLGTITSSYYKKKSYPKNAMKALAIYKEQLGFKERNKNQVVIEAKVKKLNDLKVIIETQEHKQPHPDAFRYLIIQKDVDPKFTTFTQYYQTFNLDSEEAVWTENPDKARYFTYEEVLKATQTLVKDGYKVSILHVEKA